MNLKEEIESIAMNSYAQGIGDGLTAVKEAIGELHHKIIVDSATVFAVNAIIDTAIEIAKEKKSNE